MFLIKWNNWSFFRRSQITKFTHRIRTRLINCICRNRIIIHPKLFLLQRETFLRELCQPTSSLANRILLAPLRTRTSIHYRNKLMETLQKFSVIFTCVSSHFSRRIRANFPQALLAFGGNSALTCLVHKSSETKWGEWIHDVKQRKETLQVLMFLLATFWCALVKGECDERVEWKRNNSALEKFRAIFRLDHLLRISRNYKVFRLKGEEGGGEGRRDRKQNWYYLP